MRLKMSAICEWGEDEFESVDVGEDAQEMYNRVWNMHDAQCPHKCAKVSIVIHNYERKPKYERARRGTWVATGEPYPVAVTTNDPNLRFVVRAGDKP